MLLKNSLIFLIFKKISLGNHECVAIINNYVPKESVYYFTRKQPFEEKSKLPIELAKPLHQLVMLVSMGCKIEFFFCINLPFFTDEYTSCQSGNYFKGKSNTF